MVTPEEASRSRKERRLVLLDADGGLERVSSVTGEAVEARASGLRRVGSFEDEEGVRAEMERTGVGGVLA